LSGPVLKYEGQTFEKGSVAKVTDPLTVEQALQISVNGKPFTVVMQTPGDEKELAYGLLFAEDVIDKKAAPDFEIVTNKYGFVDEVRVTVLAGQLRDGYKSVRSLLSVSSCGICGKQSLEDVAVSGAALKESEWFSTELLFKMQQKMFDNQTVFSQTGGCHGVAAFSTSGEMLTLREDIGRHNALDKVVGKLLFDKRLNEAKVISFSGRISYEIVSKAFRAGIPIVMAVSAPSSLAVDFAKEFGLTILGFTRNGKTTCYSHTNRLKI